MQAVFVCPEHQYDNDFQGHLKWLGFFIRQDEQDLLDFFISPFPACPAEREKGKYILSIL
jgi:hypothetical protein